MKARLTCHINDTVLRFQSEATVCVECMTFSVREADHNVYESQAQKEHALLKTKDSPVFLFLKGTFTTFMQGI